MQPRPAASYVYKSMRIWIAATAVIERFDLDAWAGIARTRRRVQLR